VLTLCRDLLQAYYSPLLQILLGKLDKTKSQLFRSRFVRFYHFFSARYEEGFGADAFIAAVDQIQTE
jgi:exportin-2 (importin alpha re-exporter)